MTAEDRRCWAALKEAIARHFQAAHPPFDLPLAEWKGPDIVAFQEHMRQEVQGQVSEKWFYTHLKREQDRLPRIDLLNLLAAYVGEQSWACFVAARRPPPLETPRSARRAREPWRLGIIGGGLALLLLSSWLLLRRPLTHRFCFVGADNGQPLSPAQLRVWQERQGESPMQVPVSPEGCVEVRPSGPEIRLIIQGSYFLADTLVRQAATALPEEQIAIYPDDYARLIHYFSTGNRAGWERRRQQLQEMFAPGARIFQIDPVTQHTMELYNKAEFIDKLSLPIRSLGQIEVLETRYAGGQIAYLRFYLRPQ